MAKTNEIALQTEQISLSNPNETIKFATNLRDMIVQNNLYTKIKGKNYVNVEGWQIAGAFVGVFPIVESVENLSQGNGYKYRAEVSLRDKEGNKVGYGVAICTNREAGKQNFDEYAVASMAQTRAVGKAFRMQIGWLLKVAGYETTPAEEMDAVEAVVVPQKPPVEKPKFSTRDVGIAKAQLQLAASLNELKDIYTNLGEIKAAPEVIAKKNELKAKFELEGEVDDEQN